MPNISNANPNVLVFSSIGDTSNDFLSWAKGNNQHFSSACVYYGESELRWQHITKHSKISFKSSGSKFQNLVKFFNQLPSADWYVLIDDDITLTQESISSMIDSMNENKCSVGSPSHSSLGKMSWEVMRTREGGDFRWSNFVEMTIVILKREELIKFLNAYSPVSENLASWGVDFIIQFECSQPFMIFDRVSVVNPTNEQKRISEREIDKIPFKNRNADSWNKIRINSHDRFKQQLPKTLVSKKNPIDKFK